MVSLFHICLPYWTLYTCQWSSSYLDAAQFFSKHFNIFLVWLQEPHSPLFFIFSILSTFSRTSFFYHFSAPSCLLDFIISLFPLCFFVIFLCMCFVCLSVYACVCKYVCLCITTEARRGCVSFIVLSIHLRQGPLSEPGAHFIRSQQTPAVFLLLAFSDMGCRWEQDA